MSRSVFRQLLCSLTLGMLLQAGCSDDTSLNPGEEGAACKPGGTCNTGLTCLAGICVKVKDAAPATCDGANCDVDKGTPTPDKSTPKPDKSTPDKSTPKPDKSTPDKSTPKPDKGTPKPDKGTPTPDKSTPTPDKSTPTPDKSTPTPDMIVPDMSLPDMTVLDMTVPDKSTPKPDKGPQPDSAPPDAAMPSGTVFTFAGTCAAGFNDGLANVAQFNTPTGIFGGPAGEIFIADTQNHRLRAIASGTVSTHAGTGVAGFKDGAATTTAQFSSPVALEAGPKGKGLYVSDRGNYRVRLVDSGQVSTIAGSGAKGTADGPLALASFWALGAMIGAPSGGVYVVDNFRIRLVNASGVSNYVGKTTSGYVNGSLSTAQFLAPGGMLWKPPGDLYITDQHRIRMIAGPSVSTVTGQATGGYKDGPIGGAQFNSPSSMTMDKKGHIYVADSANHRIRLIIGAVVVSAAGDGTAGMKNGSSNAARFNNPVAVMIDQSGNLLIVDQGNHCIRALKL